MFDPSKPPLVSETLLKKRRSLEDLAIIRSETVQKQKSTKRVVRGEDIKLKRPEQFLKERRIREGSKNKMLRRKSKIDSKTNAALIPKTSMKSTVGIAVRIHAGKYSSPIIKSELEKIGLRKKYDATFFRLDRNGIAKLKPLDAYVAYGFVSNKLVAELLHRRAFTFIDGVQKPLADNIIVEKLLGDKDILCLADLSQEIYNVGTNFDAALNILCPFQLSAPVGHFEKKILDSHDAVEDKGGFLEEAAMEKFMQKIL